MYVYTFQAGNFTGWGKEGVKMGSDDSHFNVSLIVRDKVSRQFPQTTTLEERGEPVSGYFTPM